MNSNIEIRRSMSPDPIDPPDAFVRGGSRSPEPEFTGRCFVTFDNADIYMGEWAQGKRNGWGTYVWADASAYTGSFVNNLAHGRGSMRHYDGSFYDGEFCNNQRHGKGIIYSKASNSWYEGQWREGRRHGLGRAWPAGGPIYQGRWDMDVWVGPDSSRSSSGCSRDPEPFSASLGIRVP